MFFGLPSEEAPRASGASANSSWFSVNSASGRGGGGWRDIRVRNIPLTLFCARLVDVLSFFLLWYGYKHKLRRIFSILPGISSEALKL